MAINRLKTHEPAGETEGSPIYYNKKEVNILSLIIFLGTTLLHSRYFSLSLVDEIYIYKAANRNGTMKMGLCVLCKSQW